ncbi:MAG: sodium:calcium antiporter, partial [Chloroflexaceae bacterium]|nr:sodium:calcium antiporter [Chloroflexaceae bacterium]
NVVGSNIFNILGILGLASIVTPGGLTVNPTIISFDMPIMVAVAVACLPIFFSGFTIARWEGALFLASYVAYTAFLIFVATSNPLLETFSNAMLLIAPLVVIVLGWTAITAYRKHGLNGPNGAASNS